MQAAAFCPQVKHRSSSCGSSSSRHCCHHGHELSLAMCSTAQGSLDACLLICVCLCACCVSCIVHSQVECSAVIHATGVWWWCACAEGGAARDKTAASNREGGVEGVESNCQAANTSSCSTVRTMQCPTKPCVHAWQHISSRDAHKTLPHSFTHQPPHAVCVCFCMCLPFPSPPFPSSLPQPPTHPQTHKHSSLWSLLLLLRLVTSSMTLTGPRTCLCPSSGVCVH